MIFEQKVYFNNKPLILTDDQQSYINSNPAAAGYVKLAGAFSQNFRLAFDYLSKLSTAGAIIEDNSIIDLQRELHSLYEPVRAGGGVVRNEDGDILMIYRRGKWDLPKGKLDKGENIEDCALREVKEETGLEQLQLKDQICETFHVYSQNNQNLLKCTTWFDMKASKNEKLKPQKEENIMEARWVKEKDLAPILLKSYEAINEVLTKSGLKTQHIPGI
jgi:ADP-ribose pyrophosphatase YjhB (NUDIX family)